MKLEWKSNVEHGHSVSQLAIGSVEWAIWKQKEEELVQEGSNWLVDKHNKLEWKSNRAHGHSFCRKAIGSMEWAQKEELVRRSKVAKTKATNTHVEGAGVEKSNEVEPGDYKTVEESMANWANPEEEKEKVKDEATESYIKGPMGPPPSYHPPRPKWQRSKPRQPMAPPPSFLLHPDMLHVDITKQSPEFVERWMTAHDIERAST